MISLPANSPTDAALMFTKSSVYNSPTDWKMGTTTSGDSYANGEFLKLAVSATEVPDQTNTASLLIGGLIVLVGFRRVAK